MKKLGKLCVVGLAIISLAGCGKVATLENGEQAIITTNNGGISANELYNALKEKYGTEMLVDMMDKLILEENYKTTTEETNYINEQIESLKSSAESYQVTYSYLLNYYGFDSEQAFKNYLSLSYKREQAVNDYIKNKLTEDEINKYYNDNIFGDINAKHILIASDATDTMTDSEKEAANTAAYNKAKEVITKLNNGESWDDLAKEYSTDTATSSNGGNLGWFSTGDMVSEFEKAARALEKDTYTKTPVETTYGYHIIYKIDEKEKPSKEDSMEEIKTKLTENKLNADTTLYYTTLENVRKDAGITFEDDNMSKKYTTYMNNLTTSTK